VRNVLFVDDDANLLAGLRRTFRHQPFSLVEASSPSAAFALLSSMDIDVVVSDERMPGMSGTDFLAMVRTQFPTAVSIMLTGHADLGVAMEAINRGEVYRFLVKPCDPVLLAQSITSALRYHDLVRGVRRLLTRVRRQAVALEALEAKAKAPAVIEVPDAPVDLDALLAEVMDELERQ
jgi:two-component system, probable response regulator PhcQ